MDRSTYSGFLLLTLITCSIFTIAHAGQNPAGTPMSSGGQQQMRSMSTQQNPMMNMMAKQIEGRDIVNNEGDNLGKVKRIVQNRQTNQLEAVVSVGGFLGLGAKQVTVPLRDLALQQDRLMLRQPLTQNQLKQQTAYQADQYRRIRAGQRLAEVPGMMPGGMTTAQKMEFQDLDTDSSGFLSQEEAQSAHGLISNWKQADTNTDNQIDRSEFSAFEERQMGRMPEDAPQVPESTPESTTQMPQEPAESN